MDGIDHLLAANGSVVISDDGTVTETEYAVFNDPDFLEPRFASGELHQDLREPLLDNPLWVGPTDSAAKRFMLFQNDQRAMNGKFTEYGFTVLRKRSLTRTPWVRVEGAELDAIDEGRRAYG